MKIPSNLTCWVLVAWMGAVVSAATPPTPNIVWIVADDLSPELERWIKDSGDMGGTPETKPTLAEIIAETRATTHAKPLKQRGLPAQIIEWWEKEYRK